MVDRPQVAEPAERTARQFSLRSLFLLTLAVAIVMTLGVLCRESKTFHALYSWWTLVTLVPIVGVCVAGLNDRMRPKTFLWAAICMYLVSLGLPAIDDSNDPIFGWQAAYITVVGLPGWIHDSVVYTPPPAKLFSFHLPNTTIYSALCGGLANALFYLALLGAVFGMRWRPIIGLTRLFAVAAPLLAALSILLLSINADMPTLLPGFGLWLAAMLALFCGARRMRRANRTLARSG